MSVGCDEGGLTKPHIKTKSGSMQLAAPRCSQMLSAHPVDTFSEKYRAMAYLRTARRSVAYVHGGNCAELFLNGAALCEVCVRALPHL